MIIKDIHIDGFGIFHDLSFLSLQKGVNIFLGENEAGKSTLLQFLRFTLFGYPRSKDQRMKPLSGGAHGGRINALMRSGEEVIFERSGTNKTKLFINGQQWMEDEKWNLMLSNATKGLYDNIYAFTLDELVGMASLTESGVEDKIFSMGMGLGDISISEVAGQITEFTNKLYTAKGKIQKIPELHRDMVALNSEIQQIQENLDQYREINEAINQLSGQIAESTEKVKRLQNDHARVDSMLRCYESFVQYSNVKNELRLLPPLKDYPEKGPAEMELVLKGIAENEEAKARLKNGSAGEKGIVEMEDILEQVALNEDLLKNRDNVEFIRLNQARYKDTLQQREEEGEKFNQLNHEIHDTIKNKIHSGWNESDVIAFENSDLHQSRVDQFALKLTQKDDQIREWEAREKAAMASQPAFDAEAMARIVALLFLLGAIPAFVYNLTVLGIILLGIAISLYFGKKAFRRKDPRIPIREKIKELSGQRKNQLAEYQTYLQNELKVSPELPFQAVPMVLQAILQTKKLIRDREILRKKIQEQRLPFLLDFEMKVKSLIPLSQRDMSNSDIYSVASVIIQEYDETVQLYNHFAKIQEELERKQKELAIVITRIQELAGKKERLLKSVDARETEEFFKTYDENNRVRSLTESMKNAVEKIETVAGMGKAQEVVDFLNQHDKLNLQQTADELSTDLEAEKESLAQLHTQMGAKNKEKERLAGESELSEKMTQLESLRQNLREAWKDWMAGRLAQQVLQSVKAEYEQERQPEVIRNAGDYFGKITVGKYTAIRTSLEGKHIQIFDSREGSKTIEQLSRGTREQLLLSLRLGFIKEYESKAEPLPIITDEVLVNFDRNRAEKSAQILQEFARDRQVLVFTCHPFTLELFDKTNAKIFNLSDA